MARNSVLVVEDDKNISKLVRYNFEKAGFSCKTVVSGEDALQTLSREMFDLVVLDIMLPGIDGLEVCRKIKQEDRLRSIPVVMLTAKGEEIDRIVGFELGADDYMVKPFSPRELILRAKAILKRSVRPAEKEENNVYRAGKITLDVPRHKVTVGKRTVELTRMEFDLLLILMKRRGRAQSRDRLLEDVWDISSDVTTRTVDTHIKRLREKLGSAGDLIETVRGIGYRFRER
jgi:DNA-binding response OmpR family regulator